MASHFIHSSSIQVHLKLNIIKDAINAHLYYPISIGSNFELYPLMNVDLKSKLRNAKKFIARMTLRDQSWFNRIKEAKVCFIDEVSSMNVDIFEFTWLILKLIKDEGSLSTDLHEGLTDLELWTIVNSTIPGMLIILVGDVLQNLPIKLKLDDQRFLYSQRQHKYLQSGDRPFFASSIFQQQFNIAMLFDGHHRGVSCKFVELSMKARVNRLSKTDAIEYMNVIGGSLFQSPEASWPTKSENSNLRSLVAIANHRENQIKKDKNAYLLLSKKMFQERLNQVTTFGAGPHAIEDSLFPHEKILVLTGENGVIAQYSRLQINSDSSEPSTTVPQFILNADDNFRNAYDSGQLPILDKTVTEELKTYEKYHSMAQWTFNLTTFLCLRM